MRGKDFDLKVLISIDSRTWVDQRFSGLDSIIDGIMLRPGPSTTIRRKHTRLACAALTRWRIGMEKA